MAKKDKSKKQNFLSFLRGIMSVNLSLIRNIDSTCRNADGELFDIVLVGESEDKKSTFCVQLPNIFDNDYELLYALKNALAVIEHQPLVKANTPELGANFMIDEGRADLLRRSHYMSDFINSTYFSFNGNMLRFVIDKRQSCVKFIKDRKLTEMYEFDGSVIPCLPDLFIKANMAKVRRDLHFYEKELKIGQKCEMIKEKRSRLAEFEAIVEPVPETYDPFMN